MKLLPYLEYKNNLGLDQRESSSAGKKERTAAEISISRRGHGQRECDCVRERPGNKRDHGLSSPGLSGSRWLRAGPYLI